MCGIAGVFDLSYEARPTREELDRMIRPLRHRGPDGTGFHIDGPVGLAHARLSIIDMASGDQPIANEDCTVWVVFNGEIFNYIELRAELEAAGHCFSTRSDTEVIVHLYEERGPDFVQKLNGQFAIALWDSRKHELLLTRDRPGIAPLFYTEDRGRMLFGSEIKALLPALSRSPSLDLVALDQILTFWAPVSPRTVFEGIREVSPGCQVIVRESGLEHRRYWDWTFSRSAEAPENEDVLASELHDLLVDATRLRLRSDVPVGAYLSGGLDSSVITALISHYGGVPLRTFSIGFSDAQLDESSFQQRMIEHLGAEHSHIRCDYADIGRALPQTIWHAEAPILRTAPVPMRLLSGLVREQGYKVVLTGEGSDEVLGGYDIFKEAKIRQFWAQHPDSQLRPLLLQRLYPYLDLSNGQGSFYVRSFFGQGLEEKDGPLFSHLPRMVTTAKIKELLSESVKSTLREDAGAALVETLPNDLTHWDPFHRAQYLEFKTLMPGYLLSSQGDRMLLAHSVEGRFPFLDHRVMEFATRVSPRLKMKVLCEKYLLKKAMQRYLPKEIVHRYKQPYRAPDIPSLFGEQRLDYAEELLSSRSIEKYGYFDSKKVDLLVRKARAGRAIGTKDNMAVVGILSTQLLHYQFIENFGTPKTPNDDSTKGQRLR